MQMAIEELWFSRSALLLTASYLPRKNEVSFSNGLEIFPGHFL